MFRNFWLYAAKFSRFRIIPIVIYIRNNRYSSLATLLAGTGCALIGYTVNRTELIRPIPNLIAAEQADKTKKKISRREKRYAEFSSKLYQDEIYMTPRDLMESLVKDESRCK